MYKVSLKTTDGKSVIDIDFPEHPSEVKLKQFIEFEVAYESLNKWLDSLDETDWRKVEVQLNYIKKIIEIISEFTGHEIIDKGLTIGDFEKHLGEMMYLKEGEQLDLDLIESSLFSLYTNIWRVFKKNKPRHRTEKDFVFEYKGKRWKMPLMLVDIISQKKIPQDLTTAELVEAAEVVRLWDMHKKNDIQGSVRFTSILKLVAILARNVKGDTFPSTDSEIEKYISERTFHFQNIDMETALDIQYFFLSSTKGLRKTGDFIGSSIHRKRVGIQKRKKKQYRR